MEILHKMHPNYMGGIKVRKVKIGRDFTLAAPLHFPLFNSLDLMWRSSFWASESPSKAPENEPFHRHIWNEFDVRIKSLLYPCNLLIKDVFVDFWITENTTDNLYDK